MATNQPPTTRCSTELGRLVEREPAKAAEKIKRALRDRTEAEAAAELGVGVRTLSRYRRKLEQLDLLDAALTPRGFGFQSRTKKAS